MNKSQYASKHFITKIWNMIQLKVKLFYRFFLYFSTSDITEMLEIHVWKFQLKYEMKGRISFISYFCYAYYFSKVTFRSDEYLNMI